MPSSQSSLFDLSDQELVVDQTEVKNQFSDDFIGQLAEELHDRGHEKASEKLLDCCKESVIRQCNSCGSYTRIPIGCKLRICPTCKIRANNALRRKYNGLIRRVHRPKHLTLTVKNVQELTDEVIVQLRNCFNKLYRKKDEIRGGLYAFDIKKVNTTQGWNVHIHALIASAYIPQEEISEDWEDITEDSGIFESSPICHIREIKEKADIQYILEYVSKDGSIEAAEDIVTYFGVMKGRRVIQPFGTLYGKNPEAIPIPCDNCGAIEFTPIALLRGALIKWSCVPLDSLINILTSLENKEISSSSDTPNPPPNSQGSGALSKIREKNQKFEEKLEKTTDKEELCRIFSDEFIEHKLKIGEIFEPINGKIKKV